MTIHVAPFTRSAAWTEPAKVTATKEKVRYEALTNGMRHRHPALTRDVSLHGGPPGHRAALRFNEHLKAAVELLPVSRTPGLGVLMRTEDADGTTIV